MPDQQLPWKTCVHLRLPAELSPLRERLLEGRDCGCVDFAIGPTSSPLRGLGGSASGRNLYAPLRLGSGADNSSARSRSPAGIERLGGEGHPVAARDRAGPRARSRPNRRREDKETKCEGEELHLWTIVRLEPGFQWEKARNVFPRSGLGTNDYLELGVGLAG